MRRKKRWIILALIVLVIGVVWFSGREPRIEPGSFLVVPLRGSYSDGHAPGVIERLFGSQRLSLTDLLLELEKAAVDTRVQGVILKVAPFALSFANVQEIRQACEALKAKQKQVIAWVAGETDRGNAEYYLASVADKVYFAETTMMPLLGLRAHYLFLGGLWDAVHLDVQAEQMREYKAFGDMFTRSTMSEAHRDMANALLDDMNDQFLQGIAKARGLTPASVQGFVDAPTLTPADYRQAGLIDGMRYFADVLRELGVDGQDASTVSLETYRRVSPTSVGLRSGAKVAVVYGAGGITAGESGRGPTGVTMGADSIITALEHATHDATIKAIILRVNSPGGSPHASDLIWHAVVRAQAVKPVIVSMSSVAASGGYYIAAGAGKVIAEPATITGSIGVVVLHVNMQKLLGQFGVHTETLTRGRYAELFDTSKSWSPAERQEVKRVTKGLYQTFVRKVAQGRGMSVEAVDGVGGGRVWTGAQAKDAGLVDALGGMATAIRVAKEEAGLPPDSSPKLVAFPKAPGMLATLLKRLSGHVWTAAELPRPLREGMAALGPFLSQQPGPLLALPLHPYIH